MILSVEKQTVDTTSPTRKPRRAQRFFTSAHTFIYRLSGGKIGGRFGKSPVLLLSTIGRKTGKQHTIPLLYMKDGNNLILVASNGGATKHPVWQLNLQANPVAVVEVGNKKLPMRARQADADEHKRLWPDLVAMYSGYAEYQKKTTREIPVVVLSPQNEVESTQG